MAAHGGGTAAHRMSHGVPALTPALTPTPTSTRALYPHTHSDHPENRIHGHAKAPHTAPQNNTCCCPESIHARTSGTCMLFNAVNQICARHEHGLSKMGRFAEPTTKMCTQIEGTHRSKSFGQAGVLTHQPPDFSCAAVNRRREVLGSLLQLCGLCLGCVAPGHKPLLLVATKELGGGGGAKHILCAEAGEGK